MKKIGIVDKDKEINRLVEESEVSNKKELERILRRCSDCYAQSKNDCGKVDKKYEHVKEGEFLPHRDNTKLIVQPKQKSEKLLKR